MLRIISAAVSLAWGIILGFGVTAAILLHPTNAPDSQRIFAAATFAGIPLAAGITAFAARTSLPLVVSWSIVLGMILQQTQRSVTHEGIDAAQWAMIVIAIAGVIVSVLSLRDERNAAKAD